MGICDGYWCSVIEASSVLTGQYDLLLFEVFEFAMESFNACSGLWLVEFTMQTMAMFIFAKYTPPPTVEVAMDWDTVDIFNPWVSWIGLKFTCTNRTLACERKQEKGCSWHNFSIFDYNSFLRATREKFKIYSKIQKILCFNLIDIFESNFAYFISGQRLKNF